MSIYAFAQESFSEIFFAFRDSASPTFDLIRLHFVVILTYYRA